MKKTYLIAFILLFSVMLISGCTEKGDQTKIVEQKQEEQGESKNNRLSLNENFTEVGLDNLEINKQILVIGMGKW